MKINDLLHYKYISIYRSTYSHVFGKAKDLKDEGDFFRLADLDIIFKNQIEKIVLIDDTIDYNKNQNGCVGRKILLTMKNGEKIEFGIADA